jgi:hypothetical protein
MHVIKFLVAVTFTGFIIFVPDGFTGASADPRIMNGGAKLGGLLEKKKCRGLADGAFASPSLVKPPRGPQIYPKCLANGQTIEDYKQMAEQKLRAVRRHAHFRSRVEHAFDRSQLGRFKIFKEWRGDTGEFLTEAMVGNIYRI